jgi:bifunctional DNase/RNase
MFEAQAIAIEIEKIVPNRPMTHDLFKSFAQSFRFSVTEIIISNLKEGVFYAKIICTDGIRHTEIDARPSDAIAIGLRFDVPIYTYEAILSEAGIVFTDSPDEDEPLIKKEEPVRVTPASPEKFKDIPFEQLKMMLEEALDKEDYERAARIRDELNKRN